MASIIKEALVLDKSAIRSIIVRSKEPGEKGDWDMEIKAKVKKADVDKLVKEYDNLVDFDDDVMV